MKAKRGCKQTLKDERDLPTKDGAFCSHDDQQGHILNKSKSNEWRLGICVQEGYDILAVIQYRENGPTFLLCALESLILSALVSLADSR